MHTRMRAATVSLSLFGLAAGALLLAGCSASMSNSAASSDATGSSFVVGTDAPMISVTSFSVQVQSIAATDSNGNTVQLLSGSPTVDFARFNGLQTLLDMNDVPAGTYDSNVTVTLGAATIGYLDTGTSAPHDQDDDGDADHEHGERVAGAAAGGNAARARRSVCALTSICTSRSVWTRMGKSRAL